MAQHILIINNEFPPTGAGSGNASYHFAKNLVKSGSRVTVVTSSFSTLPMIETIEGFLIKRVECRRKKRFESNIIEFLSFIKSASSYLVKEIKSQEESYDISICFHAIPSGAISYILFRKFRIPYIVMLRGGDVPGFLPEQLRFHHYFSMPATKVIWKNACRIIANSEGLKSLAQETANRAGKEVIMLRNGVDMSFFHSSKEKTFDGTLKMLFVGRLNKQKGVEYLIKAIAGLHEEEKNRIRLDIVGEGPEVQKIRRMIHKSSCGNIQLLGYFTKDEIRDKLNEVDLFVLPSLYEGMSNSLLEAMAAGVPALVTDVMGNRELIGNNENGIVVPSADTEALGTAIVRLLRHPEYLLKFREDTIGKVKMYDWMSITRELLDLVSDCSGR